MTEHESEGDGPAAGDERETHTCGVCGMEFDSEEALERHVHDIGIVD